MTCTEERRINRLASRPMSLHRDNAFDGLVGKKKVPTQNFRVKPNTHKVSGKDQPNFKSRHKR